VVEAPQKLESKSSRCEARELLESVEQKVHEKSLELQQKLAEAELAKKLAAQEGPDRAHVTAAAEFMKHELMMLQAQMKAIEAQRDTTLSRSAISTAEGAAVAAQNQLRVLEAQQHQIMAQFEEAVARQRELETARSNKRGRRRRISHQTRRCCLGLCLQPC
jgi:hypothetical protein